MTLGALYHNSCNAIIVLPYFTSHLKYSSKDSNILLYHIDINILPYFTSHLKYSSKDSNILLYHIDINILLILLLI